MVCQTACVKMSDNTWIPPPQRPSVDERINNDKAEIMRLRQHISELELELKLLKTME